MWMIPSNSSVIDIQDLQQIYDHLLAINQLDECMSNGSMAYKLASILTDMKYKKKMGKQTKKKYIEKYTNILKSKKWQYFVSFKQSMYVLCSC